MQYNTKFGNIILGPGVIKNPAGSGQRLFKDTPGIKLKPLEVRTTDTITHIKYLVEH